MECPQYVHASKSRMYLPLPRRSKGSLGSESLLGCTVMLDGIGGLWSYVVGASGGVFAFFC